MPGTGLEAGGQALEFDSNIRLLNRFYGIFVVACLILMTVGVRFFFVNKVGSAVVCIVLLAALLGCWRINTQGRPKDSLKLFAGFALAIGITGLYLGIAPTIVTFMMAIAAILSVVVGLRAGIVFGAIYLVAWLLYIVLDLNGMAPKPYFFAGAMAAWFHGVVSLLLVLLPVPQLVSGMRAAVRERERAERALREALQFNEAILQQSPVAMGVYRLTGECILANQAYAHLIGATLPQLLAQNFNTVVSWQASGIHAVVIAALADGERKLHSTSFTTQFGKHLWVDAIMVPMVLNDQTHLLIQFLDQTARRSSEEELRNSEERLALALEASALSMWDLDLANGSVHLDAQWAEIVGGPSGPCTVSVKRLAQATHQADIGPITQAAVDCFRQIHSNFNQEFRYRTPDGSWKWLRCSGKVVERDANGWALRAIGTNRDITERKTAEEQIRQLAYYDSLTGLPNRRMLLDRLNHALTQARRYARPLAVMFLDLDHFKNINDTLGHDAGDILLKEVAARLSTCVRAGDTLARQSGDEFVILLTEMHAKSDISSLAEKILAALRAPLHVAEHDLTISASIGISFFPVLGSDDANGLLKKADSAMYQAKQAGRNGYRFFKPSTGPVLDHDSGTSLGDLTAANPGLAR